MAKRQKRKQSKSRSLKSQTNQKLSKLANKYIEHFDNVDLLRTVGEKSDSSTLINSLGSIFEKSDEVPKDTFKDSIEDVLQKLKTLKKLIVLNISNTDGRKNFNTREYVDERKSVVDIEFKIQSTGSTNKHDLNVMNSLYKKHKRIKQLFD